MAGTIGEVAVPRSLARMTYRRELLDEGGLQPGATGIPLECELACLRAVLIILESQRDR